MRDDPTDPTDDGDGDRGGDSASADDAPSIDNPFADDATAERDDADADARVGPDSRDREDAPFGDLARSVEERRRRRESESDPFETVEVSDVDEDDLWASLGEESGPGPDPDAAEAVSAPADTPDGRPEHVVGKREYCQQCPFLSTPPTVACEHEGTDIVEVVDADRFRVRGCPMVTDDGRPDFSAGGDAGAAGDALADADPATSSDPTDPDVLGDLADRGDDA